MRTIVFTGDSITDCGHMFDTEGLGDGYVRMIQEAFPEDKIVNRGYDGYVASRIHRIWDEICIRYQPDIVTLLVGINDVGAYLCGGGGYDENGFSKYMEEIIIHTQQQTNARMILMEPFLFPKPAEYLGWMPTLHLFREKIKELCKKYNLELIPLWDIFQEAQKQYEIDELTVDGIHLTSFGHKILAEEWLKYVK